MSAFSAEKSGKICYVVTIPLTIEAFFIPQLQFLAESGFDITVICSPSDTLSARLGPSISFLPVPIPRGLSALGTLRAISRLYRIFREQQFDLIQYSTPNAALCSAIAAALAEVKLRNYHLMGLRYLGAKGLGKGILKLLEKITCALSTSIECVSSSNLRLGIREGLFPEHKAEVVWNGSTGGVDMKRFDCSKREPWRQEIRQRLNLSQEDFVFGFVGRITRDKGINELLAAFSRLDTGKLLLVGSREGVDTLDQQLLEAAERNPRIIFHPNVADVEKYFAAIDVLVLPSYREGFGNVVIEAAAMGTPAIVSNIPGPVDAIVKDATALTVSAHSLEDLLTAMEIIQKSNHRQMGIYAADFVRNHFDSTQLSKKIMNRKLKLLESVTDAFLQ